MKKLLLLSLIITSFNTIAQIPANYYDTATGSGYTLKTQLRDIVTAGHTANTYDDLYTGYVSTHSDDLAVAGYENDGSILDMYSENPAGSDPYNYTHFNNQCGNQTAEGDCYNREHLVPQSSFGSSFPMQSDIHHVVPSDGRVNNFRGSLAFGNVATADWTSLNGSLRGSSAMAGYNGTVFEPIDEFKGDIARALLYFAVRYENTVDGYTSFVMFNGTQDQVFFDWAITVLLEWHTADPVSQHEINRNTAAYNYQGNANPFVDHPEYAAMIWNPTPDTEDPTAPTNLVASNPTSSTVDLTWTASTDNVAVVSYDIYVDGSYDSSSATNSHTVTGLASETTFTFTVLAKDAANNESAQSTSADGTTLEGAASGSTCLTETFENIPANSSSYATHNWTGDDGTSWEATDARTDQSLNTRAITIRNGILTAPTTADGIGELTVTTQLVFSGSSGTFDLNVNGAFKGTIPYGASEQTTVIPNIDVTGSVTIVFDNNSSGSNRVMFDDLTWTCFSALSVDDYNLDNIRIYPNPASGNTLTIDTLEEVTISVFDILGKQVLTDAVSSTNNQIDISDLNSGIYMIRLQTENGSATKKFIKK